MNSTTEVQSLSFEKDAKALGSYPLLNLSEFNMNQGTWKIYKNMRSVIDSLDQYYFRNWIVFACFCTMQMLAIWK